MNLMVATNEKPTQKMNTKNSMERNPNKTWKKTSKSKGKRSREEKISGNNEQNVNKYVPNDNYFKYNWTKYSNQKTEWKRQIRGMVA